MRLLYTLGLGAGADQAEGIPPGLGAAPSRLGFGPKNSPVCCPSNTFLGAKDNPLESVTCKKKLSSPLFLASAFEYIHLQGAAPQNSLH